MKTAKNLLLSAVVTGSRVTSVAVTMLLLARTLGPEQFGAFAYTLTVATLLAVIPDYGFSLQLVARVAATPQAARGMLRAAVRSKTILSLIAIVAGGVWYVVKQPTASQLGLVALLLLSALALSFGQLAAYVFRALDWFNLDALSSIVLNGALVIGVVAAELTGRSLWAVALAYVAARVLYLIACLAYLRAIPPDTAEPPGGNASMLWSGLPYGVHAAVSVLYVSIDSIMLESYQGSTAVGFYQAGMRLVFASAILPEVLTAGLFPVFARALASGDDADATRIGGMMSRNLMLVGSAIALAFAALATPIRATLYGSQYALLDGLLPAFGGIIALRYAATTYGALITASGSQGKRTLVTVATAVLNLVLNLALVPRFGINGALGASLVTHAALLIAYASVARVQTGVWLMDRRTVMGLVALASIAAAIRLTGHVTTLGPALVWGFLIGVVVLAFGAPDSVRRRLPRLRRRPNPEPVT